MVSCSGSAILLTAYRDKEDSLNYVGAGGVSACMQATCYCVCMLLCVYATCAVCCMHVAHYCVLHATCILCSVALFCRYNWRPVQAEVGGDAYNRRQCTGIVDKVSS